MSHREINMITAMPENGMLRLLVTVDGKVQEYMISRHAAASAVERITKALAQST